ncbi:hypothetical protein BpHYR1_051945 [Brachionus plicatilis]|uniref:Uncharacterized protein n=1 Tax=Brachionus plicatilis TaxID=10195 RepID=A0A3M7P1N8_BRAPC|nr:hypothetical protein BpHYR1_051945 [Brachionus plicatilis]
MIVHATEKSMPIYSQKSTGRQDLLLILILEFPNQQQDIHLSLLLSLRLETYLVPRINLNLLFK